MQSNSVYSGYLDVKISARSRRGLTPWKAWQKQWCELKRLDSIENGVELKLKSSKNEGSVLNCVLLPRSSTICRTESRTKQYAFGVFGRTQKPLLFLSGASENDTQTWISTIRKMLCVATYLPVGESNFHVSIVDNLHSRAAGLVGLHGVLGTSSKEMVISDPCTGDPQISWQWYQFHQFHFQAPAHPVDDKRIIVMHTSGEFPSGPGQIYLYCEQGSRLLTHLVARGKRSKPSPGLKSSKRLSRSEGDLCNNISNLCSSDSPMCIRSQTGSDDSGVRVSISSDDSGCLLKPKTASSLISLGLAALTKTPGGSETNDDSLQDLTALEETPTKSKLPRRESGISLASGIYEEISEEPILSPKPNHIYENPIDLVFDADSKTKKHCKPPPLPPRKLDFAKRTGYKHRCNTLPAKDLSRISQIFTAESDYVVMSPSRSVKDKSKIAAIAESLYMPMSPVINLKNKIENCYMIMNGKK